MSHTETRKSLADALWHVVLGDISSAETMNIVAVRALIEAHDRNTDAEALTDAEARTALVLAAGPDGLGDIYTAIQHEFVSLELSDLTADELACLADPKRFDEALDMLDDWQANLGVSASVITQARDFATEVAQGADFGGRV